MRRVSWMAVLLGGIIDVGGTSLAGIPVVFYVMSTSDIVTLPQAEQMAAVTAFLKAHVVLYVVLAAVGSAFSVFGGYMAAFFAKRSEILNAALSSYLCLAFGISSLLSGNEQMPTWLFLLLLPLSPLLAALGGYLRIRQIEPVKLRAQRFGAAPPNKRLKLPAPVI